MCWVVTKCCEKKPGTQPEPRGFNPAVKAQKFGAHVRDLIFSGNKDVGPLTKFGMQDKNLMSSCDGLRQNLGRRLGILVMMAVVKKSGCRPDVETQPDNEVEHALERRMCDCFVATSIDVHCDVLCSPTRRVQVNRCHWHKSKRHGGKEVALR